MRETDQKIDGQTDRQRGKQYLQRLAQGIYTQKGKGGVKSASSFNKVDLVIILGLGSDQ